MSSCFSNVCVCVYTSFSNRGFHGSTKGSQRDLEYLDLWGNPGHGTPGVFSLLGPLTASPCKLRELNISQCGLAANVVPGVLTLASRGHLRALSLANNNLGPTVGPALADTLRFGSSPWR